MSDENKQPTPREEKLLHHILSGLTRIEAYKKVYPKNAHWKDSSITNKVYMILRKSHMKRRYKELYEEFQAREVAKTGWTREQAIKTLRYVVDKNVEEVDRIDLAYDDELEHLAELMRQNPEQAELYMRDILKKRKSRRLSVVNNQGITQAVGELNKMHGYNEQNITLTEQVVFAGEEDLED